MDRATPELSKREAVCVAIASLIFAAVFLYPMLSPVGQLGSNLSNWIMQPIEWQHLTRLPSNGDADLFTELRWVSYWTVVHFHQLPFWNPYKCGGMGMLSNPESAIVTPFFIFYLMFGLVAGINLDIYLHLAIMFAGGYYLGRALGLNRTAATVSAMVFPASSWFYLHLSVGHFNFLPGAYLPWVAALLFVAIESKRFLPAVIGGLLCALTLTEGNYTFLYTAIIVAIVAIVLSLISWSLRPFFSGVAIGLFGLGFAALRLFPMAQQLATYPKNPFGIEAISMQLIRRFLLSSNQDLFRPRIGFEFAWCEYGAYVSLAFVFLAAVGLVARPIKSLPWLLAAIVFVLFARGWTGEHSFVFILLYLPMGSSTGLTGRYLIPFVFCVGVIAAYGADYICANLRPRGAPFVLILLAVGAVNSWIVGAPNARYLYMYPIRTAPYSNTFRQFWTVNTGMMTEINLANMASVNCQGYGYNDIPENPRGYNQSGYRGEYYLLAGGTARETLWTPNRLRYDVDLPGPTALIINQNAYPGWHSIGDGKLYSEGGLIGVRLPAGRHSVELVYIPDRILLAVLVTLLTTLAAIVIWKIERKN